MARCEYNHAIPEGWRHDLLESQPPLPKFWSCMIWRGDTVEERYFGRSDESPEQVMDLAVANMRAALQQPPATLHSTKDDNAKS